MSQKYCDSVDPLDESQDARAPQMSYGDKNCDDHVKDVNEQSSDNNKIGSSGDDENSEHDNWGKTPSNTENQTSTKKAKPEGTVGFKPSAKKAKPEGTVVTPGFKGKLPEYVQLILKFFTVYLDVFIIFLALCSIYWGSCYKRFDRFTNMDMLVALDERPFEMTNGTQAQPVVSSALHNMFSTNETVKKLGGWTFMNSTELGSLARKHNSSNYEEAVRQLHHQKYWAVLYVHPHTTERIYESMVNANGSLIASGEINSLIVMVYESGRHYSALSQYVTKNLYRVHDTWQDFYAGPQVYNTLIDQYLTASQRRSLLRSSNGTAIISTKPAFQYVDNRPSKTSAVLGPSELGLIYAQMFSFHQFNLSLEIYAFIRKILKYKHYLIWRILASHINCIMLSLIYALITIAFQTPINVTFGHSGFLVLWSFMYLFIAASGGINEVIVTLILAFDNKKLIAPWMVLNLVINISVTFAPLELSPRFYRYGYAMPMFNAYEALKVVFFDTWKGHLGRELGVLICWIVVTNILVLILTKWVSELAKKKQAKLDKEKQTKLDNEKRDNAEIKADK